MTTFNTGRFRLNRMYVLIRMSDALNVILLLLHPEIEKGRKRDMIIFLISGEAREYS